MNERYDHQELKRRLAFLDLMAQEGVALRRQGPHWVGRCPFHEERSGSYTVHGPEHDHAHCYGCGWHGDIFDFWMARHGGDFKEAVVGLAGLVSLSPSYFAAKRCELGAVAEVSQTGHAPREKPALPRLRGMNEMEVAALAELRGLSVAGIAAAAREKRVGICEWPQFQDHREEWRVVDGAGPSWVMTDLRREVAQFRRMDGAKYARKDGREIKAWTKGSPTWPVGASEMGDRGNVLLVEGGADMLAGYHFLHLFNRLGQVAICGMLGASCAIREAALPFFRRRRVRIIVHEDEAKDERGIRPGYEAAARWTRQLTEAGAAVETFSLAGLVRKDGGAVKDLNDLALADESVWMDRELIQAFYDFEF